MRVSQALLIKIQACLFTLKREREKWREDLPSRDSTKRTLERDKQVGRNIFPFPQAESASEEKEEEEEEEEEEEDWVILWAKNAWARLQHLLARGRWRNGERERRDLWGNLRTKKWPLLKLNPAHFCRGYRVGLREHNEFKSAPCSRGGGEGGGGESKRERFHFGFSLISLFFFPESWQSILLFPLHSDDVCTRKGEDSKVLERLAKAIVFPPPSPLFPKEIKRDCCFGPSSLPPLSFPKPFIVPPV